jgi:hypothetical protein
MAAAIIKSSRNETIIQFSIFADNKVGRLNELIRLLSCHSIQVVALTTQDTTDSTIIRIIVNYPDDAREMLKQNGYSFTSSEMIVVEIDDASKLRKVLYALVEAELNIHYIYPFIFRPHGKSALAMHLEDNEVAKNTLETHQLKVLNQSDIAR